MTLTAGNVTSLKSTRQEVRCRFLSFPEYETTSIFSGNVAAGVAYTFVDLVNMEPRYSWADNSAEITIDGSGSIQHGGAAAVGHSWTLTADDGGAAAGAIVDNGDSVVYTAPANGSGIDRLKLTTTGNSNNNYAYIAYGDVNRNIGQVTGFHADLGRGGWEMTVRAFGDCSGLGRQQAVLLKMDTYWNGSESTFGNYQWQNGVFAGYVHARRTIHEDSALAYVELTLVSPQALLAKTYLHSEVFFSEGAEADAVQIEPYYAVDAAWWLIDKCCFNERNNCYIYDDDNEITNLKISPGPVWDVMADIAGRTFGQIHCNRQGDFFLLPDPDVRWEDYQASIAEELDMATDLFECIDIVSQDIDWRKEDLSDPDPDDPEIGQVVFNALDSDLEEIWARWPANANAMNGKKVEVSGLICEDAGVLETWARRYWFKLQPQLEGDLRLFAMPIWDLLFWLTLTYTPDSNRITNTGIESSPEQSDFYVTSIDYEIDPGMGTWRGGIHFVNQAKQGVVNLGENSDD